MARGAAHAHADAGLRVLHTSHAAPEQLDRQLGTPSPATDVFAFALIFFEAIAGRPYFAPGTHPSDVLRIVKTREPLVRRSLGRELEAVLSRALSIAPRERSPQKR